MDFGLLGPLLVRDGLTQVPVPARRQRVLLAALLLSPDRVVSLDALAETLWDGAPPAGARGALHSTVQRLRSTLGPAGSGLVHTKAPGYLIEVGDGELDVRSFGSLVAQGQAAAAAGRWDQAAGLLRQALGLWRGEPLADVPSTLLRTREVPPLEDRRLHALALRIDADLWLGRDSELVPELRALVAAHPLQEKFHAQLMLGLYRSGQPADALSAYQDVRRMLADELGVDPGPELRRLQQAILAGDPELLRPPGAAGSAGQAARRDREPLHEPVVPRQLPTATRYFAGRAGELRRLAAPLADAAEASAAVTIVTIDGTAGVGKTTLAVHFAHQVAERFRDGQLYVNLRGFDPAGPPMPTGRGDQAVPGHAHLARRRAAGQPGRPGWAVPQPARGQADAAAARQRAGRRPGPPAAARQPRLPGHRHQPQPADQPGRGRGRVPGDAGRAD